MRSDASRNHEAILSAAIDVLARTPEATMQELAAASGTGRTTLYRHFPDREALLDAAHERVIDEAEAITVRALAVDGEPAEVLADLAVELAGLGDRYRFLDLTSAPGSERPTKHEHHGSGVLLAYLDGHQHRGGLRCDLDAEWLFDVLVALILEAARADGDRSRELRTTVMSVLTA